MQTEYLTPNDVASILGKSKAQVHQLIDDEAFPSTRYHKRIIVKADDLNRYMAGKPECVNGSVQTEA